MRFEVVHVFRLYLAPFVRAYLDNPAGTRPCCCLDLDDWESRTLGRLADLYETNGELARAHLERTEAANYARLEDEFLPRFDAVCLAGEVDRVGLAGRYGNGAFVHVPNAVRTPHALATKQRRDPFTLLFVGSMSFYPNEDAVRFFCRDVLPRLRARLSGRMRLVIAGTLPSPAVLALSELPEVTVTGAVPDLAPLYRDADVVIAPVRAGGGSRIKVLEAFAHRRPVVTTSAGVEGIDAHDGEHLLIADTAHGFADACARLHEAPAFGAALAERAAALVGDAYALDRVVERIRILPRHRSHRPCAP